MVDIQPQQNSQQSISDDQELAQVLAGVNQQVETNLQFEETPAPKPAEPPQQEQQSIEVPATPEPATPPQPSSGSDDLEPIKNEAINELRPLVDKLDLPAEEKFDTYLLLLRSTDDRSLIAPAHTAAQGITDESRKAQALLDIIKEIDYLNNPQTSQS